MKLYRPPESHENGKRVINGVPHTYDPAGGPRGKGRWIADVTPSDGQPNQGGPPLTTHFETGPPKTLVAGALSPATSFGDTSSITTPTMDKRSAKLSLYMKIQALQEQYDAFE
jgi:hypothetical protein